MSPFPARFRLTSSTALGALLLLSGCAGSGQTPNTASDPTVVPGAIATPGAASAGDISVTGTSVVRTGSQLAVTATVHNSGSSADELLSIGSQVSPTLTLTPALTIPAGATRKLGSGGVKAVLSQQLRLESGGTVALSLQFQNAGVLQVFSSFTG